MKHANVSQQYGFSLLEVLIASLVLSIGLLGLAGLQMVNIKVTQNSAQKQQASHLMQDLIERMRLNKPAVYKGQYNNTAIACGSPPPSCTVTACTSAAMAASDLYQVVCGSANSGGGLKQKLMNSALSITCPTGDCKGKVRVSIQWVERSSHPSAEEDKGTTPNTMSVDVTM